MSGKKERKLVINADEVIIRANKVIIVEDDHKKGSHSNPWLNENVGGAGRRHHDDHHKHGEEAGEEHHEHDRNRGDERRHRMDFWF